MQHLNTFGTLANSFYQQVSSYPLFSGVNDAFEHVKSFIFGLDPSHLAMVAFAFTLVGAGIVSFTVLCELSRVLDKQDRLYKQITIFECNVNRLIIGLFNEHRDELDDALRYQENKITSLQEKLNDTNETLKVVTYILFKIDEERAEREKNKKDEGDQKDEGNQKDEGKKYINGDVWAVADSFSDSDGVPDLELSEESEEEKPEKPVKKTIKKTIKKTDKRKKTKSTKQK